MTELLIDPREFESRSTFHLTADGVVETVSVVNESSDLGPGYGYGMRWRPPEILEEE